MKIAGLLRGELGVAEDAHEEPHDLKGKQLKHVPFILKQVCGGHIQ
jgi:hypothetical protein